jgi:ubiquitin C-terminal hydrolase
MSEQTQQARVMSQQHQDQIMSQQHQQAEKPHGSAGLRNLGNTCFANSVLQFLHCIPDLKSALIRFDSNNYLNFW